MRVRSHWICRLDTIIAIFYNRWDQRCSERAHVGRLCNKPNHLWPKSKNSHSSFLDILVSRYGSGPLIICKSEGFIPLFFLKLISLINTHLLSRLQDLSVIQWEAQQRSAPSVLWSTVQHVHSRADGCFVVCPLCFKCDEFAYVLSEMHFQDFFFFYVCVCSAVTLRRMRTSWPSKKISTRTAQRVIAIATPAQRGVKCRPKTNPLTWYMLVSISISLFVCQWLSDFSTGSLVCCQ